MQVLLYFIQISLLCSDHIRKNKEKRKGKKTKTKTEKSLKHFFLCAPYVGIYMTCFPPR